jgi:subtilisin family serine protease
MKVLQLSAWLVALAVVAGSTAHAADGAKRVIITFKTGTSVEQRQKALSALGATTVSEVLSTDQSHSFVAVVVTVPAAPAAPTTPSLPGMPPKAASVMALDQAPTLAGVEKVEEDYKVRWIEAMPAFSAPASSLKSLGIASFSASPASMGVSKANRGEIPWGVARLKAPSAWDYTEGAGVRVAVIDTGIDSSHPDLNGKVDGGYNAITDCERQDCWQDDNGHGTHVSGTIAAARDGRGVVGVAPKARLYAVKVLDSEGSGNLSDVIKGIIWCANNGIQVANMSLGSPMPSDTMQKALRYAKARGVIVVAAAGNSGGSVGYPGAYPETIAVAASDWEDNIASFSSRGDEVKFIAPGVSILSSAMGGDFASMSGTSMASPHVAGLAALVVSQGYRGLDGPDGVLAQMKKAAVKLPNLTAQEQGYGMIDAGKLVRGAQMLSASAR